MATITNVLLLGLSCIHLLVIAILLILWYRSEEQDEFVTLKKGKIPEEHDEFVAFKKAKIPEEHDEL